MAEGLPKLPVVETQPNWQLVTRVDEPAGDLWVNMDHCVKISANGKGGTQLYMSDGSTMAIAGEPGDVVPVPN